MADCRLPIEEVTIDDCRLDCRLPTVDWIVELSTADWIVDLLIADWIDDWASVDVIGDFRMTIEVFIASLESSGE